MGPAFSPHTSYQHPYPIDCILFIRHVRMMIDIEGGWMTLEPASRHCGADRVRLSLVRSDCIYIQRSQSLR
jgi:hypothetical protein